MEEKTRERRREVEETLHCLVREERRRAREEEEKGERRCISGIKEK